jgi:diguanylate cyclase (GGDEF)-like protein
VLPGCRTLDLARLTGRIRAAIAEAPVRTPAGLLPVTCSFGAIASQQAPGVDADALLRAADAALYRAKRCGRNRVELALSSDVPELGLSCA